MTVIIVIHAIVLGFACYASYMIYKAFQDDKKHKSIMELIDLQSHLIFHEKSASISDSASVEKRLKLASDLTIAIGELVKNREGYSVKQMKDTVKVFKEKILCETTKI